MKSSLKHPAKGQEILLVGSYNGQESFGDKCLLASVMNRFQGALRGAARFTAHVEGSVDFELPQTGPIRFSQGFLSAVATWRSRLRHLHLPFSTTGLIAAVTFPVSILLDRRARAAALLAWEDVGKARLMYFYGGTQLSQQWFWLNFPGLIVTIMACRMRTVPVYFGPQQYGPESRWQSFFLRMAMRLFVRSARARNPDCLSVAGLPLESLLYDEVFSCTTRYPLVALSDPDGEYLLVNCRGTSFVDGTMPTDVRAFARLVAEVVRRMGVSVKVFQMSAPSFCDDTGVVETIRREYPHLSVSLLPGITKENDLIMCASRAVATLSMSFHGCILSMIAGKPAVPVVTGAYYIHKYSDFDRYCGNQQIPVVQLDEAVDTPSVERISREIIDYFGRFDVSRAADARRQAGGQMGEWYRSMVKPLIGQRR